MTDTIMHETKTHGKLSFPFIVYRGNIPEYICSYPLHWHDEMEIIYVEKGCGTVIVPSGKYVLQTGDMIIIPPQTVHSIEQFENRPMEYFNILFQFSLLIDTPSDNCYEKFFLPFYQHTKIFPSYLNTNDKLNQLLLPYVTDLIENRKQSNTGYELMVKSNLFAIMHYLNQYSTPSNHMELSLQNTYDKLKKLLLYVKENYNHTITIPQAAAICGFSESHFMKLFKELTGKSFTQYLKDYRLEIASRKLLETHEKIIEISENTGFPNHSYFSRSFYAKYGVSPSAYRKNTHQ